jgi:hypothetical protein
MQRLIDDPALRTELEAGARIRAERFAATRVLPRFERLYEVVLAGTPASRAGAR